MLSSKRLERIFKMFDSDNSGKISIKEVYNVFGGN